MQCVLVGITPSVFSSVSTTMELFFHGTIENRSESNFSRSKPLADDQRSCFSGFFVVVVFFVFISTNKFCIK